MSRRILIAHAPGEESVAELFAGPLREAGYEVSHAGTVLIGESVVQEASRLLLEGAPVVLCGTVKALGTGWAHRLVNAARSYAGVRVFPIQVEKDAFIQQLSFEDKVGLYWQDPERAIAELISSLNKYFPVEEVKAALENAREAAVKEPLINLPNTMKQILARDQEAEALLKALRTDGPGIVSIAAPPGFGKSAVFALALQMALPDGDFDGIAVLDAKTAEPGIASFAHLLGRITGLQEIAARFPSAAEHPDGSLRALFFDFLRRAGKVWLVVENAEEVLARPTASDFRDLLTAWCQAGHQAKLLLLTRHSLHPAPECHRGLSEVEQALLGGLPEDAAVQLLRQRLADTRFRQTGEPLLRQIAQRLHRVPLALEQFAGYLHLNEQGVDLDQRFVEGNDLLRLHASEQMPRIIQENLNLLDAPSLDLVRVVAWAGMPVPWSGLMGLRQDGGPLLTRLSRSNLLLVHEGTAAEGRSFDMHPLIREALAEQAGGAMDFPRIVQVFGKAGKAEGEQTQFRPALALFTLAERAARIAGKRDDLAAAIVNRGNALWNLGRLEESLAAYDQSIVVYRELVEKEHSRELRNELAKAIMNRGAALRNLGRLEEALAAYDESIAIWRVLVEKERRAELRNELATAIMNRGSALWYLGRLEEALAAYDESIAIYRELVKKEDRQDWRSELAGAIMGRGAALDVLGQWKEAVAAYDESIAMYRGLVEKEHRQELRNELAKAIMNRGVALMNLGRLEEAVATCDESIAIRRELVEREHRLELRNDLALVLYNLAGAREKQGAMPAALEAAREARQLWEDLLKEGMKHLERDLADARKLETRLARGSG